MKSKIPLLILVVFCIFLSGAVAAGAPHVEGSQSSGNQPSTFNLQPSTVPLGSAFTYQGRLKNAGSPANGPHDFEFRLYDAATGGTQIGSTQTVLTQTVANGLFTVQLDFGHTAFQGEARWLEVGVRTPGGGTFTPLSPRQPLTAAPSAMSLVPGATINASTGSTVLAVNNSSGGTSVYGYNSANGFGVHGQGNINTGVYGESNFSTGVWGYSAGGTGTFGANGSNTGIGVYGVVSSTNAAVYGVNNGSGSGVRGETAAFAGVIGRNEGTGAGVYGSSSAGAGGYFVGGGIGLYAQGDASDAGYFFGDVHVQGFFSKLAGSFKIDHPLDPENKYLYHSFVECPDMMNIYNGNVNLDAAGEAWVDLPDWFEALNREFRYQLTAIGAPGPNLYVAQEVKDRRFKVAGGTPGMKVSWQVTGIRRDAYAEAHRIPVEEAKPDNERGKYLSPVEHGRPESKGIDYERRVQAVGR